MRWLITVVVIAIIAFVGYRYFYTDEGQQVAQQVEETAGEAAQAVEETAEEAAEAVEGATDQAADAAEQAAESTEQATESTEQAVDEAADTAQQAAESATESAEQSMAALTVDGVNLGEEIGTTVSDATSALEGITDKASAEAALPSLQGVESKLDELSSKVEQLPQQAKEALASLLDDSLPELKELASKVEGIEGVGEVIKPTLDGIMAKLDAWAQQPA